MKRWFGNDQGITWEVAPPIAYSQTGDNASPEHSTHPKVALFISHGMGQQVPFETLELAVAGLVGYANSNGNQISTIRTRRVQIGELKTQRVEFDMRDAHGKDVEVHSYEGYWAPFTEGALSLRDVMKFLFFAGINGLKNTGWPCFKKPFERWIFGRSVEFDSKHASAQLLITLLVLLSLVVLNAVTTYVAVSKFFNPFGLNETILAALTTVTGYYLLFTLIFGGLLWLQLKIKKWKKSCPQITGWRAFTGAVQLILWLWIVITILLGLLISLLVTGCIRPETFVSGCLAQHGLTIWLLMLVVSWKVRNLIVQYLGDVAAYIDSHSLDRFSNMRRDIKTAVFDLAKAVYTQHYERIVMIGHSLGSVVIYDTLNALINHDELNKNKLNVSRRTKLLLTFGSPLDKTAFIFASQSNATSETREALAATVQPLIQKYDTYRDIKWINIYSPRDIVSGELNFYDDKVARGYSETRKVHNVIDEEALIPLAAHNEYWDNPTLFGQLYGNL